MSFEAAKGPQDLGRRLWKASSAHDLNLSTTKQLQMISGKAARRARREGTAAERLRWWVRGLFMLRGHWKNRVMWSAGNIEKIGNGWGRGRGRLALTPRDGSLSVLLWGNFLLFFFFFSHRDREVTQETQCC